MNDTMQRSLAGRGPLRSVDRFDGLDIGFAVRRYGHGRQLEPIPFQETDSFGLGNELVLDGLEAYRQTRDEPGLDQRPGAVDLGRHALGDLGDDLDAG